MKHPLFVATIFFCSAAFGQNLVPNPGFEEYIGLPSNLGQLDDSCLHWTNCGGYGTTDYHHMNGSGLAILPMNVAAYVLPHSGDAIAGFLPYTELISLPNYQEYLMAPLLSSLEVGTKYSVSFWLTNGFSDITYGYSSDHIGLKFSVSPLVHTPWIPLGNPFFEITGEVWETSWKQFEFEFTADSAYNYIIIGNFLDDDSISATQQIFPSSSILKSYYFIDDVSVIPETITNVGSKVNFTEFRIEVFQNPAYESTTITSSDPLNFISLYDGLGKLVLQKDAERKNQIKLNLSHLPSGIYLVVVIGDNGERLTNQLIKK